MTHNPHATSLDELLADIAAAGLLVTNLFQYDDGVWRTNLRREVEGGFKAYPFGEGPTAYYALLAAFSCVTPDEPVVLDRPVIVANSLAKVRSGGVQLLRELGL